VVDAGDANGGEAVEVVTGDALGKVVDGGSVFLSLDDELVVDVVILTTQVTS